MSSLALLQSLKESILGQASVKTIYGEPISAQGKTIIPVAKIMYSYIAGAASGGVGDTSAGGEGGGGGGGGGGTSCPRGRYRSEQSADPFRSDRQKEADRCSVSGNWLRYVVWLA